MPRKRPRCTTTVVEYGGHGHPSWNIGIIERIDGVCWAVVWDGLTAHDGPERLDPEDAACDLVNLVNHLENTAARAKAWTGTAGSN